LQLYLTGFYESRKWGEVEKIAQKVAGEKYEVQAFTVFGLTISMVDFLLQAAHRPCVNRNLTHGLYPSTMSDGAPKVKIVLAPVCGSPNLSPSPCKLALASLQTKVN
jgi:hypothetical protein